MPNEGHVFLGDQEITDFPVYKRARAGIGYLPQEASVSADPRSHTRMAASVLDII